MYKQTHTDSITPAHTNTHSSAHLSHSLFLFLNHNIAACSIWSQPTTGVQQMPVWWKCARVIQVFSVCPVLPWILFCCSGLPGYIWKRDPERVPVFILDGARLPSMTRSPSWFGSCQLLSPHSPQPSGVSISTFSSLKIFQVMEFFGDLMKGMDPLLQYMDICTLKQGPEYKL